MGTIDDPTVISRIGVSLSTQFKAKVLDYDYGTISMLCLENLAIYSQEAGRLKD